MTYFGKFYNSDFVINLIQTKLEEMEQRIDELSMTMKDSEKHQKNQNSEIERLRQENKSQKANIKEAEDQVRRTEETIERLKKIKQENCL